jgi:tetratricopeptide (TPR) repeat protein
MIKKNLKSKNMRLPSQKIRCIGNLNKTLKIVFLATTLCHSVRWKQGVVLASDIDDDYLQLDKRMLENKKVAAERANKLVLIENESLSNREKEILKRSASSNEKIREEALQELSNIEKEKENAKKELEKQKQSLLKREEENKKLARDTEEYSTKMKEIEVEKEKIKLKEEELKDFNEKIKEQEGKIKEQQRKIDADKKNFEARQEEIKLQNIQKEKEMERQLSLKQKELEEKIALREKELLTRQVEIDNGRKELEEQKLKIQKEKDEEQKLKIKKEKEEEQKLKIQKERENKEKENKEKQEKQKLEESLKNNNNEIKQIIAKSSEELRQELSILKEEQQKTLQDIKYVSAINTGKKGIVKNSNYNDSLFIVNKIENNLTHSKKTKKNNDAFISIKKGSWDDNNVVEVEQKEFEMKKTSKKQNVESVLTEKAKEIKSLRDKAYVAVQSGDYEAGVVYYKKALEKDEGDNFTKLSLATTYHAMGQYKQAKPLYLELVDVFPQSEQIVSNLLSIMIQESPYEAVYLIPSIAERHQDSAIIQAQMGVAFASVEKYLEAIKYTQKALAIDPYNVDFKYNLALFYDLNKNYKEAKKLYNEVLTDNISDKVKVNNIKKRLSKI